VISVAISIMLGHDIKFLHIFAVIDGDFRGHLY
jgi:hypothetical protein